MRATLIIVAAVLVFSGSLQAQGSLRDRVRKEGDIGIVILHEYHGAEMAELVRESDLIARVLVQGEKVRLSKDETKVLTDYSAQVLKVLHSTSPGNEPSSAITLTKDGGTLVLEGRKITANEGDFPALKLGAEYVVFLRRDGSGGYLFQYGAQGVFSVESGKVEQLSRHHGAWKQQRGDTPTSIASFLDEVRQSVIATKKQ